MSEGQMPGGRIGKECPEDIVLQSQLDKHKAKHRELTDIEYYVEIYLFR